MSKIGIFINCIMYGIFKFKINSDNSINVNGDVNLSCSHLKKIPLNFNYVSGDFDMSDNFITSLKGAPKHVGGNFYASNNFITSLEYAPVYVGECFSVKNNKIKTLEHCPELKGNYNFHYNKFPELVSRILLGGYSHNNILNVFIKYQDYYEVWNDGFNAESYHNLMNEIENGLL